MQTLPNTKLNMEIDIKSELEKEERRGKVEKKKVIAKTLDNENFEIGTCSKKRV